MEKVTERKEEKDTPSNVVADFDTFLLVTYRVR
jgi:hypothetical protein